MSWIVESLLNNRDEIKTEHDLASTEFNDLLAVEKAIEDLRKENRISDNDLEILGLKESESYRSMNRNERYTFYKKRSLLCERVAYFLGGYFTDEGYLNYMKNKYRLTSEQIERLRKYIKSEYKYKIMRKPINE